MFAIIRVVAVNLTVNVTHVIGHHSVRGAVRVEFVGIDWVKVGSVSVVLDLWNIGGSLFAKTALEVNAFEERVSLDLICAILTNPLFRTAA